ncbi:DUF2922 domain-containing protein [Clostridium cylindrosporum]|uniref:DUF2922 domain-containing protein n=1 Tax=Clostridium cylindrosporum DSM 605 TaxID=1121307 RepID=A0A0J8D8D8_CLOCY|nr:DUF2922 domain-containing protein [Clostridium cylindrosporum]KMT22320.1 hypothetical protein CLCY_17c00140 [Clostridium cylindrosporum DSM 605]
MYKKVLSLYFLDSNEEVHRINIPEVKDTITSAEIRALAELIVDSDVFGFENAQMVKAVSAKVIETSTTEITY